MFNDKCVYDFDMKELYIFCLLDYYFEFFCFCKCVTTNYLPVSEALEFSFSKKE